MKDLVESIYMAVVVCDRFCATENPVEFTDKLVFNYLQEGLSCRDEETLRAVEIALVREHEKYIGERDCPFSQQIYPAFMRVRAKLAE